MQSFYIPPAQAKKHKNTWIAIYFKVKNDLGQEIEIRRKVKLLNLDESQDFIEFLDGENNKFTWPLSYIDHLSIIR